MVLDIAAFYYINNFFRDIGGQIRDALKAYTKAEGLPAATELLKDFGCSRGGELLNLPVADKHEFIRLAQKGAKI